MDGKMHFVASKPLLIISNILNKRIDLMGILLLSVRYLLVHRASKQLHSISNHCRSSSAFQNQLCFISCPRYYCNFRFLSEDRISVNEIRNLAFPAYLHNALPQLFQFPSIASRIYVTQPNCHKTIFSNPIELFP